MNRVQRRRLMLAWSPAALFMAAIWVLSSFALAVPLVARFPFRDKGVHYCIYTALGLLIVRAARITWPQRSAFRVAAFGALATMLWGLSDELHQAFVPGRSAELLDFLADTLGALTAATLSLLLWSLRRARSASAAGEAKTASRHMERSSRASDTDAREREAQGVEARGVEARGVEAHSVEVARVQDAQS